MIIAARASGDMKKVADSISYVTELKKLAKQKAKWEEEIPNKGFVLEMFLDEKTCRTCHFYDASYSFCKKFGYEVNNFCPKNNCPDHQSTSSAHVLNPL